MGVHLSGEPSRLAYACEAGMKPAVVSVRGMDTVLTPVVTGPRYTPWGMLAAIDLHGCHRSRLADPDSIRRFVPALIDAIGMRAHGPLHLDRFGDESLEGWSALQFIETSSITVHADETWGRCFIDVFSCKPFAAEKAAALAVMEFGGTAELRVLER